MGSVTLYNASKEQWYDEELNSISAALTATTTATVEGWLPSDTYSITCDSTYTGEKNDVTGTGVDASIKILGGNVSFYDDSASEHNYKDLSLGGKIELGSTAKIVKVGNVTSTKNGIELANLATVSASADIFAEGTDGNITLGKSAMVSGSTIYASGDITLADGTSTSKTKVSGSTIYAYGMIEVGDDASIEASAVDGNIEAWDSDGGITLGDSSEMIAGSTIYSAGKIKVGKNTTVKSYNANVWADSDDITLGKSAMVSGSTIYAHGDITLADGTTTKKTTVSGGTIYAHGLIEVGDDASIEATAESGNIEAWDSDGGITLGDSSEMVAGSTIYSAGKIKVGKNTKVEATNGSIWANSGNIKLGASSDMIAGSTVYASGDITLSDGTSSEDKTTVSGSTVYASGKILVGDNASVKATAESGNIEAWGSDGITLGASSEMVAGSTIYSAGAINVGASSEMVAGSTIYAAGDIDIGSNAKVLIGSSDEKDLPETPVVKLVDKGGMIAGGTIGAATRIEVEDSAKVLVGVSESEIEEYDDYTGIKVFSGSVMTAESIKATTIENYGTITVDATGYDITANGMKKVIETPAEITGGGALTAKGGDNFQITSYIQDGYWLTDISRGPIYVDSNWNIGDFGVTAKVGTTPVEQRYSLYNAFDNVSAAVSTATSVSSITKIIVEPCTLSATAYLSDVTTEMNNVDYVTNNKNVYGGKKYTATPGGTVTTSSNLTINGDETKCKFVSGGNLISLPDTSTVTVNAATNLTINGGQYNNSVAGADKVTKGTLVRTASNLTITGGEFNCPVAGGILFTGSGSADGGTTLGSATTRITGGNFGEGAWLYGGSFASTKGDDDENSASGRNKITGSVSITIDNSETASTANPLTLSYIVAGSHGYGTINGNTTLTFTGKGIIGSDTYMTITGELWGGCSGDNYKYSVGANNKLNKTLQSHVKGSRILSFSGFEGALDCTRIRAFSHISFTDSSSVKLNSSSYDLSEIENWSFEYGSCLTDSDFVNDFTGDKLTLTIYSDDWNWQTPEDDWIVMSNSNEKAFTGFDSFAENGVQLGWDNPATFDEDHNAWVSTNYALYCSGNDMKLTTIASYNERVELGTLA